MVSILPSLKIGKPCVEPLTIERVEILEDVVNVSCFPVISTVELIVVTPDVVDKLIFVPADRFGEISPVIKREAVISPNALSNKIFCNPPWSLNVVKPVLSIVT